MKYVTFSYDDNAALDEKLLEILARYGAKCTFNLNSGMRTPGKIANFFLGSRKMLSVEDMAAMLRGTEHEIACHGKEHLDLTKLSEKDMAENLRFDKDFLEKLFKREMKGFIYPFGAYSDATTKAVREAGFAYTRTTVSTHDFRPPEDCLVWHPTCHHNDKELFDLARRFLEAPAGDDLLFYVWGHSWEYGVFKNWSRLEKLLDMLTVTEGITFATNAEVMERCRKNDDGKKNDLK